MQFGILIIANIDNLLIQATDKRTCRLHAEIIILVLPNLGYGVNFWNWEVTSSKTVEHLGFIWDSNKMLGSLLHTMIDKIVSRAKMALKEGQMKAGSIILLLGSLKSLRFATTLATLHICGL